MNGVSLGSKGMLAAPKKSKIRTSRLYQYPRQEFAIRFYRKVPVSLTSWE